MKIFVNPFLAVPRTFFAIPKIFLGLSSTPFFLAIRKNGSQERPQYLKFIHWSAFNEVLYLSTISVLYYKVLWL